MKCYHATRGGKTAHATFARLHCRTRNRIPHQTGRPQMDTTNPQRRARIVTSVVSLATALCIVGCATERLAASAPKGVDLTGEWQLNNNLSDDPTKAMDNDRGQSPNGGMRRRGGRGGGGGPFGMPGGAGGRGGAAPGNDDFTNGAPNTGARVLGGC